MEFHHSPKLIINIYFIIVFAVRKNNTAYFTVLSAEHTRSKDEYSPSALLAAERNNTVGLVIYYLVFLRDNLYFLTFLR